MVKFLENPLILSNGGKWSQFGEYLKHFVSHGFICPSKTGLFEKLSHLEQVRNGYVDGSVLITFQELRSFLVEVVEIFIIVTPVSAF